MDGYKWMQRQTQDHKAKQSKMNVTRCTDDDEQGQQGEEGVGRRRKGLHLSFIPDTER